MATLSLPPIGPVARALRLNGVLSLRFGVRPLPNAPLAIWRDAVGSTFLYTAANWGAVTWALEVTVRATSAKALAQLYDVTAAAAVANSQVTVDAGPAGVLLTPTRVRSAPITLVDGHEYRVQYGVQDGGAGAAVGAKLIAI